MSFFWSIWNGITSTVALFLPLGKGAARALRSPAARWALHILAVVAVLVLLYWLNLVFNIAPKIRSTVRVLADVWLPVLGLLVYSLAWLGWWLWRLLNAEEEVSYYPDIDAAWDVAVSTLGQAGVQVTDLPLFLVLGRPEGPEGLDPAEKERKAEEALFHQAAQLPIKVRQVPAGPQAPLRVYATHDAIFVTCTGASLLGRQAALLAGDIEEAATEAAPGGEGSPEGTVDPYQTVGQNAPQVRQIVGVVRDIAKRGGTATEEDRRLLRRLERRGGRQAALVKDTVAVADLSARLRHLCRLVMRDRQPWCPINGLLVLIPLAATDSDDDAQNTAECLARDLQTLRAVLKVDCPQFALLCDLEMLPGFRDFISRQKPEDLKKRVGQRFPMGTDVRGEPLAEALEGSVGWLCLNTLRDWVYRLFRVEAPGRDEMPVAVTSNSRLFLMLGELREREGRLARVLTRGLLAGSDGSPRFGGCYLAGTGVEPTQQAFVPGVFRRLTEAQNYVAWTAQARAEDARYQRLAGLGYSILTGLGVLLVAAVGWTIFGPKSGPR